MNNGDGIKTRGLAPRKKFARDEAAAAALAAKAVLDHHGFLVRRAAAIAARCPWVDRDDLIQAGRLALFLACRQWRPERGAKLLTFAAHYVAREMEREAAYNAPGMPVGAHRSDAGARARAVVSLDEPLDHEGDRSIRDTLPSEEGDGFADESAYAKVRSLVNELPPRERAVMQAAMNGQTRSQCAAEMKLTRERVRQIYNSGMLRLRQAFR